MEKVIKQTFGKYDVLSSFSEEDHVIKGSIVVVDRKLKKEVTHQTFFVSKKNFNPLREALERVLVEHRCPICKFSYSASIDVVPFHECPVCGEAEMQTVELKIVSKRIPYEKE